MNKSNQVKPSKKNNLLCFINPLKNNVMNQSNQAQPSKKNNVMNQSNQVKPSKKNNVMNKLIMGLSCLGVLSTISCDNDKKEQKIAPTLEKVTFSAAISNLVSNQDDVSGGGEDSEFKIEDGDKVTLYIVAGDGTSTTAARYYKEKGEIVGTEFPEDGKEFEFVADDLGGGVFTLKDGFYLEAGNGDGIQYTIKKFDITKKGDGTTYELKQYQSFNVVVGGPFTVNVQVIKVKKSVTGEPAPLNLEAAKFSVEEATVDNNTFRVKFLKANQTNVYFNSKKDNGSVIHLTVKAGNDIIYNIPDLFEAVGDSEGTKAYEIFTITVPKEISSYNGFEVVATLTSEGQEFSFRKEEVPGGYLFHELVASASATATEPAGGASTGTGQGAAKGGTGDTATAGEDETKSPGPTK